MLNIAIKLLSGLSSKGQRASYLNKKQKDSFKSNSINIWIKVGTIKRSEA